VHNAVKLEMADKISQHCRKDLANWDAEILAVYNTGERQQRLGELIDFRLCIMITALTPPPSDFQPAARFGQWWVQCDRNEIISELLPFVVVLVQKKV
jgi:hypothetical protein